MNTDLPLNSPGVSNNKVEERFIKVRDKPKRPLSAYNLFYQSERIRLLAAQPPNSKKPTFADLARTVAASWKVVDQATKKQYEDLARDKKILYHQELKKWRGQIKKRRRQEQEEEERKRAASDSGAVPSSSEVAVAAAAAAAAAAVGDSDEGSASTTTTSQLSPPPSPALNDRAASQQYGNQQHHHYGGGANNVFVPFSFPSRRISIPAVQFDNDTSSQHFNNWGSGMHQEGKQQDHEISMLRRWQQQQRQQHQQDSMLGLQQCNNVMWGDLSTAAPRFPFPQQQQDCLSTQTVPQPPLAPLRPAARPWGNQQCHKEQAGASSGIPSPRQFPEDSLRNFVTRGVLLQQQRERQHQREQQQQQVESARRMSRLQHEQQSWSYQTGIETLANELDEDQIDCLIGLFRS